MKVPLIALLLLAGCASGLPGRLPAETAVFTPTRDIAGPAPGISKRCVPQPSGAGADCRPL